MSVAGAVDVGQPDARRSNRSGWSNHGASSIVDLGAEAAVAEVRPVADLAVADAHEVGEPVAGHVGEVDRLRAVGEDAAAGRCSSSSACGDALPPGRSRPRQRRVPGEGVVLGDQHVGVAVAGQVDEAQVRVVPVDVRQRLEGREGAPSRLARCARRSRASARRARRDRAVRRRRGRGAAAGHSPSGEADGSRATSFVDAAPKSARRRDCGL